MSMMRRGRTFESDSSFARVVVALRALRALGAAALCACEAGSSHPESEPEAATTGSPPAVAQVIDSTIPPAIAGEGGWNYQQTAEVDLTGDGLAERVVLTARVEMYRGRPAWDDGQAWQVYVESGGGIRTYLYIQRLQLGTLTLRVAAPEPGSLPSIVLLEQLPDRIRVIEATYPGVNSMPLVVVRFERSLDPRGETASPRLP